MRTFKHIALIFLAILIWTVFISLGFVEGFLLKDITSKDSPEGFIEATKERIAEDFVGNFAMILIEKGEISEELTYSIGRPVNDQSIFPVASISKWITSFGVMKLVEQGKLDLDRPVDEYLSRWHLPKSDFDNSQVTVRRLLSHSSGLVDGLGYDGFPANEPIQTIEESLTKASDSGYSDGRAIIGYEPGSQYLYSGAGYTILQLLIEEISGQSFEEYIEQEVLKPLNMEHSTFEFHQNPSPQFVQVFKDDGTIRPMNKFTALAASGLYTSTGDLAKFLIANISENRVLSQETIQSMANAETFIGDIEVYGLGPHLYSQNDTNSKIIGHDGSGNNAINTAARIDLDSKSGIIILETGNRDMASILADEWMFWKAGIADFVVMQRNIPFLLTILVVGYLLIITFGVLIIRKRIKFQKTASIS